MPPLSISTLAADEYATAVAFVNTTSPERAERAVSWHHADQQAGEGDLRRFVAIKDGGQMVGYGAIWPARSPRFRLDLVVDLVTAQDVGAPLLEHLERELRRVGAATAQARAHEEQHALLAFLQAHAYVETQRMHALRLDVATAVSSCVPRWVQDAARERRIVTLADERSSDPDHHLSRLHALQDAARADWPDPDPGPPAALTSADFLRRLQDQAALPDAFFIAQHGRAYVGYSGVAPLPQDRRVLASTGTAVTPAYRRQGVATALRVRAVTYARQHGYTALVTHTASPVMLAINESVGFRRESAEVRLVKTL